jgi:protein-S-isoprenylcysteine O-methyltransferase Ste14
MLFLLYAAARHPDWIRPSDTPGLRTAGAYIWLFGALLSLWPLWYLRRSFSVEPEARELVTSGPYGWARHPIYAVYLVINGGILLSHFTVPLAAVLAGWLALLLVRVRYEERVLAATFPQYHDYSRRVGAFGPRLVRQ